MGYAHNNELSMHERLINHTSTRVHFSQYQAPSSYTEGTSRWHHYSCVCVGYCKRSSTTVFQVLATSGYKSINCVLVCKPVRKHNLSNLIGPHSDTLEFARTWKTAISI